MKLKELLEKKGYKGIALETLPSQHLLLKVKINGENGRFILDTGASLTCVGKEFESNFNITKKKKTIKAIGAGTSSIDTNLTKKNKLKFSKLPALTLPVILLDLNHINTAMESIGVKKVHGIIGADVLESYKAKIDYTKKILYLKKKK